MPDRIDVKSQKKHRLPIVKDTSDEWQHEVRRSVSDVYAALEKIWTALKGAGIVTGNL